MDLITRPETGKLAGFQDQPKEPAALSASMRYSCAAPGKDTLCMKAPTAFKLLELTDIGRSLCISGGYTLCCDNRKNQ
jgi:hypothetical protein